VAQQGSEGPWFNSKFGPQLEARRVESRGVGDGAGSGSALPIS